MTKQSTKYSTVTVNQIAEFLQQRLREEKSREDNRKALMKREFSKATKDKVVVISNNYK